MKKFWILLVLVMALIMTSCDPLSDLPTDPVVISAFPDRDSIPYGKGTYIKVVCENVSYFMMKGKRYDGITSVIPTENLYMTETFIIEAFGFDGKSKTATAKVVVIMPDAPSISVTAPTDAIPFYGNAKVDWKVEGIFNKITLDGVDITSEPTGSKSYEKLIATATHTLTAEGPGGATIKEFAINVGDWSTSPIGLLTHVGWKLKLIEVKNQFTINQDWVIPYKLDEESLAKKYVYTLSGKLEVYNGDNKLSIDYWLIEKDGKVMIGQSGNSFLDEIITLTKDTLILVTETNITSGGVKYPSYNRGTYVH